MSPAFTLILVSSFGWSAQTDAEREVRMLVAAVVLEMAEASVRPSDEPAPAALSVADVRYWYDVFAPALAAAPAVDPAALVTYSTALPIFRDKP